MRSKRTKLIHRKRRGLGFDRDRIEKLGEDSEFKSVQTAASAGGIIIPSSELDQLKKHWRGATQTERDQFDTWLREERRNNFWRSYRELHQTTPKLKDGLPGRSVTFWAAAKGPGNS